MEGIVEDGRRLEELGGTRQITVELNGKTVTRTVEDCQTLAEFLRETLGLIGTKVSCDEQVCGSCTVLVDSAPVSSCTFLALEVDGKNVTTVEGLASPDGTLHPMQQAFIDQFAFQCGFCTSGMIMSALALLSENPDAEREEIVAFMDGTLCRCTGYLPIVAAIEQVQNTAQGPGP